MTPPRAERTLRKFDELETSAGVVRMSADEIRARRASQGIGSAQSVGHGNHRDEASTESEEPPFAEWPEDTELHCTDAGNGTRFALMHPDAFRYLADRDAWVIWDGRRWRDAVEGELLRAAKQVAAKMYRDFEKVEDPDTRKRMVNFALRTADAGRLERMIKLASSELVFETSSTKFDQHHHLLNVANGTVDLRTGDLRPHDRADCITKLTPIRFNPAATCPRWLQFLDEVFASDAELIVFIQRAVGYTLTGHTREHAFFVLHGAGKNGKGRFVRQVMQLLGDAGHTTSFVTFTADRNKQVGNTPELAALVGARVVSAGEPDEGVRLSESVIKTLTGEDPIQVCRKYENPFSFVPTFKLWLHTNHKPEIRGTDEGIWRRPRLVPFNVSFEGRADLSLDEKLDAEAEGILAWAVEGARQWFAGGLGQAEAVRAATADYREESDSLGAFLDVHLTKKAGGFVSSKALYATYQAWCAENGADAWKPQTLSKALVGRGYRSRRGAVVRGFEDIELVTAHDGMTARDS